MGYLVEAGNASLYDRVECDSKVGRNFLKAVDGRSDETDGPTLLSTRNNRKTISWHLDVCETHSADAITVKLATSVPARSPSTGRTVQSYQNRSVVVMPTWDALDTIAGVRRLCG